MAKVSKITTKIRILCENLLKFISRRFTKFSNAFGIVPVKPLFARERKNKIVNLRKVN